MQKHKSIFLSLSIVIILILSAAFIYWNPFLSRQDAENEIASFMTDLLVKQGPIGAETPSDYLYIQEFNSPIKHIETSDQPWRNASQQTTIIVWAPPMDNLNADKYFNVLRMEDPISVWWYFDNTLISASDKTEAIAKYVELYISDAPEAVLFL